MLSFAGINWLAVIVATLVAYFLGALWYSSILFGKKWMQALGKSREELPAPTVPMLIGFICTFITAVALALIIKGLGVTTLLGGALVGLVVSVGFIATNTLSDYLYSGEKLRIFWIHAGYRVVYIVIIGAILGVWQ